MDKYLTFSKRDAEIWVESEYPMTVVSDRYGGCYSGGAYIAFPCEVYEVDESVAGEDGECMAFWYDFKGVVGRGSTVEEAIRDLRRGMEKIANQ